MALPEISTFSFDNAATLWRCDSETLGFDLAIQDKQGSPSAECYALLIKAEPELGSIFKAAHKYISAFCPAKDIGERAEVAIIELSAEHWRETEALKCYFNYAGDTYGLWSVTFTWDQLNKWLPVAFGRDTW